jgi:hypothetical protein
VRPDRDVTEAYAPPPPPADTVDAKLKVAVAPPPPAPIASMEISETKSAGIDHDPVEVRKMTVLVI